MSSQPAIVTGVDFVSVCTSDLAASRAFYADVLDPDGNALALHHRYAPRRGG